ncbi:MAG TPA: XRE family transcriptional regulator [Myxococcales bacterium]|nr:XRE family transcriptional regulator [Myxococcales bacterium]
MTEDLQARLARNVRSLRDARGFTQQQMARLSGVPRATWANLESGAANPTLSVLTRVAQVLQVSLEELVAAPRATARVYPRGVLPVRTRGDVELRRLLPDPIAGMEMDRLALPPGARLTGIPHTEGTREYLACEAGEIVLRAAGEEHRLQAGDVAVFRGDQRHSYANPGRAPAIGYSVVVLAPGEPG